MVQAQAQAYPVDLQGNMMMDGDADGDDVAANDDDMLVMKLNPFTA